MEYERDLFVNVKNIVKEQTARWSQTIQKHSIKKKKENEKKGKCYNIKN